MRHCHLWTFEGQNTTTSYPRASSTFCSHKAFIGFLFGWLVPSLYCIIENIHCLLVFGIWASVSAYCPKGDISSESLWFKSVFPPVRFLCFIGELYVSLPFSFFMDLEWICKKAVRLQTSRRSEQPLSQFVTLDKSETDKQTKKCKKFGFPPRFDQTKLRPAPSTPSNPPHIFIDPPHPRSPPIPVASLPYPLLDIAIITLWYKCWTPKIGRRGWLRRLSICPGSGGGRSWRSCWRWWVRGPAAVRWWAASPWTVACSP